MKNIHKRKEDFYRAIYDFKILLVSATEKEVALLQSLFPQIDICITGIGIAHTVYHLTKKLQSYKYDMVIEVGIAGSMEEGLSLCETVLVYQDFFGDLGVFENGKFQSIFNPNFMERNPFHYDEKGFLKNENPYLSKLAFKRVYASTVNEITTSIDRISYLKKQGIQIESMEGAAVHFVCLNEGVSFLQIRNISNKVGERDKSQWKLKEAIEQLTQDTQDIIFYIQNYETKNRD
ncbi:MAG: futalosine hydrolase [Chitinophagaceae bacterium]